MAWASVLIMTLSLFIASVFLMLAYTSNLFLQSIESKPHIYVFFNPGTSEENIQALNDSLLEREEIATIEYTNEEGALSEFKSVQERTNPQVADKIRDNVLPASLGIRLTSIEDADTIIQLLEEEQETNTDIFTVRFSKETIDTIRSLFQALRLGGGIIMALLLIVIFLFTLLTVEFRTFSRQEEIGIMQLVGGSVWFIRMPFILEGAVYGVLGSLLSTSFLYGLCYFIFVASRDSKEVTFIVNFLGNLQWPDFEILHFILLFIIMLVIGGLIGMFNGLIAIRRHIK
ncbi:MAG: Cell division protein FtsX [candidate division WS6 bacterium OLB20]|uniref:Cell division protein FtsX n=1 Tax=candidate division WS6 bacterium OLB20 TaxID=1617426 RepID=A0A136LXV2_9BACT|nr:MAG: Cell division protein FtsX [candidate division WS6 bacterium OLB20]